MRALVGAALCTVFAWSPASPVEAAVVDAGAVTSVSVEAHLYDSRLGAAGGCDPAGCVGELTRDGDSTTPDSRWSCSPSLGSAGESCSITYTLADAADIVGLHVAMYKGDTRTRSIDVYVDDVMVTSWASSGTTTDFENVDIGVAGQTVELRGVLADSEWLSVTEVEILVDDGDANNAVPASSLTTVTTSAPLFDTTSAVDGGCDPSGCTASNTQDDEMADWSRWSCAPKLGGACSISYTFGMALDLSELRLALYNGDTRVRTMDVYVDGTLVTTWTSTGTTAGFESIDLSGTSGSVIEIVGVLGNSEWLSIIETEIMALPDGTTPPPSPTTPIPTPAPVAGASPAPASPTTGTEQEAGEVGTVTATSDRYDTNLSGAGGCDPAGCSADLTRDGDLTEASRWSCAPKLGGECSVSYDLGAVRDLSQLRLAMYEGDTRARTVEVYVDGVLVTTWTSSGTTAGFESIDLSGTSGSVVEIVGVLGDSEWLSIIEVEILVLENDGTATPAPSPTAGTVLQPVGLTPLAIGDGSILDRFAVKDGDLGTSWTCTGDPREPINGITYYECELFFGLVYSRNVKQIKIALADGADRAVDMRISSTSGDGVEKFVTSSGTTTRLETYDFDYAMSSVRIAAIFSGPQESITISEVEIVEEVVEGEEPGNSSENDTVYVGSTMIEWWDGDGYPEFVAEGTGDQHAINGAICAVKKATYDGTDCIGGDDTATGTVDLSFGAWHVDGSIVMKSGVLLKGRFTDDDAPYSTDIQLEESAAGNTDMEAIIVMDGISDAWIKDLWPRGEYDPEANLPVGSGYGPACVSVTNSQNITCEDIAMRFCDGDAMVVRNSQLVNIDAGRFDDELRPWTVSRSRGTGLIVDSSDSVWVRRNAVYDNGVAGIHITGSNNFTFEATIDSECYGDPCVREGEGYVGSLDGQQPIEIIIESSSLVTFQDMKVQSANDPVMTVSDSTAVSFNNGGFSNVGTGTCIIETDDPSTVTFDADEDELSLVGACYVKV